MGRLIDANKLIEQIWQKHKEVEESYDLCVDELKEVFCGIVALVDEQPTVFDVDKVVEQLKEVEKIMTSPVTEDCFGEECRASDCTVCLISKAIEIVKGGGADA